MSPYINKRELAKEAINKGISEHKRWVALAKAMAAGIKSDDQFVLAPTECDFGKWFYSDGREYSELPVYKEMEDIHNAIHDLYLIFLQNKKQPVKPGFLQSKKSAEDKKKENLGAIIQKMEELADLFASKLEEFEAEHLH